MSMRVLIQARSDPASNVANLDTPGYRRISVSFEDELQDARRSGNADPGTLTAEVSVEDRPAQLEDELMELADTQMRSQLASRALHEHFSRVRTGITGRAL